MQCKLRIPESHPMREQLESAITDLLTFVEAGSVYVSSISPSNLPVIITFILKRNCGQDDGMISDSSRKIAKRYPDFIFRFVNSFRASYGFKQRVPYLLMHCTIKELVYHEPKNKFFYPLRGRAKKYIDKAKFNFTEDRDVSMVGFRNALEHIKNNKSIEAAFNLYQAIWGLYSCYSGFLIGEFSEEWEAGDLVDEYKRVVRYAPSLKEILDYDNPLDQEIFTFLGSAYSCTKQNMQMAEISWAVIERAKEKVLLLDKKLQSMFGEFAREFKIKFKQIKQREFLWKAVSADQLQSNYIVNNALSEISESILTGINARAIYCFGYRIVNQEGVEGKNNFTRNFPDFHFYLLVLHKEHIQNAASVLQAKIHEKFDGKYQATILCHSLKNFSRYGQNKKWFFQTIIQNGIVAYNNPIIPFSLRDTDTQRDFESTRLYWKNRTMAADQFLALADSCQSNEEALMKNTLIHQAVEQMALGLINVITGYNPTEQSMPNLLSLLKFIQAVDFPFNDQEKDDELFKILKLNITVLKHHNLTSYDITLSNLLFEKCVDFISKAVKFGTATVESWNVKIVDK